MSNFVSKMPFFRLLLPTVLAVVVAAFVADIPSPWTICAAGAGTMLSSFLIHEKRQFSYRWLFGAGVLIFIFGLTTIVFQYRDTQSEFVFSEKTALYVGTVMDIPQEKPRSFACNVAVGYPVRKKIVVYLRKDDKARNVNPGDEIAFNAQIQPFKNFGNPDDFDYSRFMRNKGFSGSAYLPSTSWDASGKENISLYVLAQRLRKNALEFYRLFELDANTYSFISALTLGYKHELDDKLQAAFRASGTSHVLAVSGLHVSIIFAVFAVLLSFLVRNPKGLVFRQILIVTLLWLYAFMTGLSASVVRATIMLTIVCFGLALQKKGFTYNSLAAAGWFILIYNPQSLFDVGFQMSFMAVFFILFFQPKLARFYNPQNRATKFIWNLCTVSLAAQMGLTPVVLYYFGTFPTYFFIANILVIPLIMLIIYCCVPLILLTLLNSLQFSIINILFELFKWILKLLINFVLFIVHYIETLPFSQVTNSHLSLPQAILAVAILLSFTIFMKTKRSRIFIASLAEVLLFALTFTYGQIFQKPPQLVIFNKANISDIGLYANRKRIYFDLDRNGFIPHQKMSILRLSENRYGEIEADKPLKIDVLILSQDRSFSMTQLTRIFLPKQVVLDSSIPQFARTRLAEECAVLRISAYDVAQEGAFFIDL